MTREEAIKRLEDTFEGWNMWVMDTDSPASKMSKALGMAIAALREQDATDTNVGCKTNADHTRSMTDEHLVQWLGDCCPPNDKWTSCGGEESGDPNSCKKCWLDWLKQPFK